MFEYRQILTRMRLGDTDRAIVRTGLMGRRKVAALRRVTEAAGWLDPKTVLPEDVELARPLTPRAVKPSSISLVEANRATVEAWHGQGIQGTTIYAVLVRRNGICGSYSSVRRFLAGLEAARPRMTTVLEFDPAEAAQVSASELVLSAALAEATNVPGNAR